MKNTAAVALSKKRARKLRRRLGRRGNERTACIAHTTGLLDWRRANQALFIISPWHYPDGIKARVINLRDVYEKIFIGLIDDLPRRKGVDFYLRLTLIGALSWSLFWFKKERDTPATIAKQILSTLRADIDDAK